MHLNSFLLLCWSRRTPIELEYHEGIEYRGCCLYVKKILWCGGCNPPCSLAELIGTTCTFIGKRCVRYLGHFAVIPYLRLVKVDHCRKVWLIIIGHAVSHHIQFTGYGKICKKTKYLTPRHMNTPQREGSSMTSAGLDAQVVTLFVNRGQSHETMTKTMFWW